MFTFRSLGLVQPPLLNLDQYKSTLFLPELLPSFPLANIIYIPSSEKVIEPALTFSLFIFSPSFFNELNSTFAPRVFTSNRSVNGVPVPLYIFSEILFETKKSLSFENEGEYSANSVFIASKFLTL